MPVFRPLLISAIISSLTLVGCAQPNGKPIITFMKNSQPLSGKWYGQATCSNGEVSKLSLDVNGTASGKLSGALAISQSNNRSGVYSFNGQFEQDATLRLTPVQWQQKTGNPSNLALTGKADDVNQPTVIRGNVPECGGTFELGRTVKNQSNAPSKTATNISNENNTRELIGSELIGIKIEDYAEFEKMLLNKGFKPKQKRKYFDAITSLRGKSSSWSVYQAWKNNQLFFIAKNGDGLITDVKLIDNKFAVDFTGNNGTESCDGGVFCNIGKKVSATTPERAIFTSLNPKWSSKKSEAHWGSAQTQSGVWEVDQQGKIIELKNVDLSCILYPGA